MKAAIERRRQPRYRLSDGALAVSANTPGRILNISMGGISFTYQHSEEPVEDSETVDILDGQNDFFMEAIPCRVVFVKKALTNEPSFGMIRMMQCSLEFGALTRSQRVDLETYIGNYRGQ